MRFGLWQTLMSARHPDPSLPSNASDPTIHPYPELASASPHAIAAAPHCSPTPAPAAEVHRARPHAGVGAAAAPRLIAAAGAEHGAFIIELRVV